MCLRERCRIRFEPNPIGIEAVDIATVFSVVEPRAISSPMSVVFWFVTFSASVYELSYSLAFADLKITTARLPAVRTAHDTAPAKANRPLRRVASTDRAINCLDLSKSRGRDMEASAVIYVPCFQRYMSCFNFPTAGMRTYYTLHIFASILLD